MEMKSFTVTELNNHIKGRLELDPTLANVCVRGELSNYKIYPSGHHYFTLKDATGSLRCVMFKSSAQKLRFRPENGMGVVVTGRVSVFTRDGAYQLYCSELSPEGFGDLYLAYEQLKAKLMSEGLFDLSRKKPLPRYPGRIAVITSGAGAAVRDIIRILGKRWPLAKVLILPVRVQGAEAPPEIAGAIRYCNRHALADLIITGRGGGSLEDLWAFNDELVVRAISDSVIPVISAVGHEPDVTISDFAADLRAATPSNAAELAVPDAAEQLAIVQGLSLRAFQAMRKKTSELSAKLNGLKSRRVMESPRAYVDLRRMELDLLRGKLAAAAEKYYSENRHRFVRLVASLEALSPLKVLGRGYSIVTDGEGHILRDAAGVSPGDSVQVILDKGRLQCTVEDSYVDRTEF
jgi:exodeoxyribonuclease VII large subunit